MSDIAIRVEGLSKQYRIGARQEKYKALRDSIADAAQAPLRLARRLAGREARAAEQTIWALRDVSFDVKRGEVVGIIGRNGAGKSTLLKILSRITEPTAGRAEIYGRVGSLLEVGTGFHPELTGRENIFLNGAILGMRRGEIERRFDEIVEFAEVEQFVDTPVKHYSSGMYLRLAFAVAAHLEPEILVVDEVLAVGDAQFQKKCLGKMGEVAKTGQTVLFVSHNMAAISHLCTRTAVLGQGSVKYLGDTPTAIRRYLADVSAVKKDISTSKDRSGSGEAVVSGVTFVGEDGEEKGLVISGEGVVIAVDYNSKKRGELRNVIFELKFSSVAGERLFTLSTYLKNENFAVLPPYGRVYCKLPSLQLVPDVYIISTIMYINNELCDVVADAARIEVMEGDYYSSGRKVRREVYGTFLVPHSWYGARSSWKSEG